MSRHLAASTSIVAVIQSILVASQNGGGGLNPCSLGHDHLPQGCCIQNLKVPNDGDSYGAGDDNNDNGDGDGGGSGGGGVGVVVSVVTVMVIMMRRGL